MKILRSENESVAVVYNKELLTLTARQLWEPHDIGKLGRYFELRKKSLLIDATTCFDSYLQYLEWNRVPEEKFYMPRRKTLLPIVEAIQALVDDELDELFLSMPPRTGKTSLLMFLATWIVGRFPELSNLYSAFADPVTASFYSGVLEVITDPVTYLWSDVFPGKQIASTNAKDETFNIDRKKRYASLTCRSLYGALNGTCDSNGYLISDDLISGIEEAMSKDRLLSAWSKVDNNLIPRAKEKAKLLWCGTRWSMIDPAGIRIELLENDAKYANRRMKAINVSALDENDESNFGYLYGVGFSTEYYHQRRASFERNNDMASWHAQYMGEPIERSGTLFAPDDMKYYNGELPNDIPDRILMAVDPAWGGNDFVAAPIIYQYGNMYYVHDVVYSDADKKITRPLIVGKIKLHQIQAAHFEANKMTADYKDWIEEELKKDGYRLNITNSAAPADKAKEMRIYDRAPEIREFCYRESGKRSKEYSLFMQNLFSFKVGGKNKHDDAPDSLAIAVDMVRGAHASVKATIFKRPF